MDADLKQELEYLNENLKSITKDLNMIYCKITNIEDKLEKEEK